jgi:hypothetical protein
MSMDSCVCCNRMVDTDCDADCYGNPARKCQCESCREANEPVEGWLPIELAPLDRELELAVYIIPSEEACRNGSRPFWDIGEGRWLWANYWSSILGGRPSHFKPKEGIAA